jgi:hypothetical protein
MPDHGGRRKSPYGKALSPDGKGPDGKGPDGNRPRDGEPPRGLERRSPRAQSVGAAMGLIPDRSSRVTRMAARVMISPSSMIPAETM